MKMSFGLVLFAVALGFVTVELLGAEPAAVSIETAKDHIDLLAGKDLVGRYNIGASVAKPYIWPLNGPGGVRVTRSWPMEEAAPGGSTDHPHQKSVWFCHGDIIPEGIAVKDKIKGIEGVDFWSETKGHGKIVCTQVVGTQAQRDSGKASETRNEWRMADGTKVLDEARTIRLYNFGDTRLFVFDIDLHASVCPITFGDTKEGSFGVRVNDILREQLGKGKQGTGKIENADGKVGELKCWGQKSPWCDYSGPIDGKVVGLAIFDDPTNPYPACWHVRGYGLMAANPFGRARSGFPVMIGQRDLVKMAKGDHLKLRYGLLIHSGDAAGGMVGKYYQQFVKLKG